MSNDVYIEPAVIASMMYLHVCDESPPLAVMMASTAHALLISRTYIYIGAYCAGDLAQVVMANSTIESKVSEDPTTDV